MVGHYAEACNPLHHWGANDLGSVRVMNLVGPNGEAHQDMLVNLADDIPAFAGQFQRACRSHRNGALRSVEPANLGTRKSRQGNSTRRSVSFAGGSAGVAMEIALAP